MGMSLAAPPAPASPSTGAVLSRPDPAAPSVVREPAAARAVATAALLALVVCLAGAEIRGMMVESGAAGYLRGSTNVFYHLFGRFEGPFIMATALGAAVALVAALLALRGTLRTEPVGAHGAVECLAERMAGSPRATLVIALLVLLVAAVGEQVAMNGILLSMDEWAAAFQARIFLNGEVEHSIDAWWRQFLGAILPLYVRWRESTGAWMIAYLPTYTATKAALMAVGLDRLTNPLYGALTIVAIASVARRLWPGRPLRALAAVLFLATSAQFLLMSMSGYAMAAHLLFNLWFLALHLRGDRPGHAAAPWVGVLALGINNPFPHALFVAPFLVRLLVRRRWPLVAYYGAVYVTGVIGWYLWLRYSFPPADEGGLGRLFTMPGIRSAIVAGASWTQVLTWQAPLMMVCALAAIVRWRERGDAERDMAIGAALMLGFYLFVVLDQGHGWGYRYVYGALGSLALLAASGASLLGRAIGRTRAATLLAASAAVALAVQLPVRMKVAHDFTAPYANALRWIRTRPEPIVVIDPSVAWYGRDLVRNDPLLREEPVVVVPWSLTPLGWQLLQQRAGGRGVRVVTPDDLAAQGLQTWPAETGAAR